MKIEDFVYYPRLGGYKFTDKSCAFGIPAYQDRHGRWHRYQQCARKITTHRDGYGFCLRHAAIVDLSMNSER